MRGTLERIWVKRARKGVMDAAESARLLEDHGVEGNPRHGSRRQVTIIAREAWEAMMRELGADVDPSERRANLMVSGIDLHDTRGHVQIVGECANEIGGETRPCERKDDAHPGLREAMKPDWRGGVFGRVLVGGTVRRGDSVELRGLGA
jgi:MOSC domain-containing protein YiiM